MAKGHPDFLKTLQDPTAKTAPTVDASGWLSCSVLDGSGMGGTIGVVGNGTMTLVTTGSDSTTWTPSTADYKVKFNVLHVSSNDPDTMMLVKLEDLTGGITIVEQYFKGGVHIGLGGVITNAENSHKITITNNAAATKTFKWTIYYAELPE